MQINNTWNVTRCKNCQLIFWVFYLEVYTTINMLGLLLTKKMGIFFRCGCKCLFFYLKISYLLTTIVLNLISLSSDHKLSLYNIYSNIIIVRTLLLLLNETQRSRLDTICHFKSAVNNFNFCSFVWSFVRTTVPIYWSSVLGILQESYNTRLSLIDMWQDKVEKGL